MRKIPSAVSQSPAPVSRAQAREIDRIARDEYGLPTIVLMENAARALADEAISACGRLGSPRILIATGPGSNGGDGLAAGRLLHNAGADVLIAPLAAPTSGDSLVQWAIVQRMRVPMLPWREALGKAPARPLIVIDAIFGTGLSRPVEGEAACFITALNGLRGTDGLVIAADLPSGLDADTGWVLGAAVTADVTVTFGAAKVGFAAPSALKLVGRVVVADLGVPAEILGRVVRG